jgi:2',3'-cyclic-nucleotide 2'-phosphodiesterase/3'-nucleotidase/5'-nucleotidase
VLLGTSAVTDVSPFSPGSGASSSRWNLGGRADFVLSSAAVPAEPYVYSQSDYRCCALRLARGGDRYPCRSLEFTPLSTYQVDENDNFFDEGAAEIAAFAPGVNRLFVTNANANTIDILNLSDQGILSFYSTIDIGAIAQAEGLDLGGINSVAVNSQGGYLAAAVEAGIKQDPGSVVFFDLEGIYQTAVEVGSLPDMLTFTPDGNKLLVANEGEPNDDYTVDPEGSVSIIDVSGGLGDLTGKVQTATFNDFDDDQQALIDAGVRIFGPGATVSEDLEPEYIAVSPDGTTAYVSLQENNALGILDIATGEITSIVPLGFKDHSEAGNGFDASNRDDAINIQTHPVFGMYQPDAIATYEVQGETYVVTANEGDARDYDGFSEEDRVKDLDLDPTAFPDADTLQADENLGRLNITTTLGDTDGDGDYDQLFAYGARSFSIWDAEGNLVWDSGDQFEQKLAALLPDDFNATNDENDSFDNRSDDKGPEPEGIAIGRVGSRIYAFIGLERVGGIMMYDITDPDNPQFVNYVNNRDFSGDAEAGTAGDLGPEGVLFIDQDQSPTGQNLLVVTNEISGTTTVYSASVPEPGTVLGLLALGTIGAGTLSRKGQRQPTE